MNNVNPMETCSQTDEELAFGLILAPFGAKKGPIYDHWVAHVLQTS